MKKAYYYAHRTGACPRGKLYNKFHNLKSKLREATKSDLKGKQVKVRIECDTATEEDHIRALKFDNLNQEEILFNWKCCINTRINVINFCENTGEIFKKWPHFKYALGYKLVSIFLANFSKFICITKL